MKKATKFNTVLGVFNIIFFIVIAVCAYLRGGLNRIIDIAKGIFEFAVSYFQGLPTLWNGNIVAIAIFAALAILVIITLALMIASLVKKQGHFWEPLSIPCLAAMVALVIKNPRVVLGVTQIGTDTIYGVRCLATICALVGVLVYMIIAVSVISRKKQPAPAVEEKPAPEATPVEEVKEEPVVEEPAPVVEEKPQPVEAKPSPAKKEKAPVKEETPVVPLRESKPVFIIDENGNKVYPGRDFEDRLYEADPVLLQMYSDLKNEFLSYRKVHTRVSKTNDAFRFEGQLVGKMIVSGKGLKVYLALDPLSVDSAIYHQRDASGKKKFVETPLEVKVKSPLSYRKAKQLIALAMEQVGTVRKTRYTPIDWTKPNAKEKVEA